MPDIQEVHYLERIVRIQVLQGGSIVWIQRQRDSQQIRRSDAKHTERDENDVKIAGDLVFRDPLKASILLGDPVVQVTHGRNA